MLNLLSFLIIPFMGSINSESFPRVLSSEEELELLKKASLGDIDARNLLIEHNLRLVAHIIKKYENTRIDKEDLLSIGSFGLIKAVDSYKLESGTKLATYASRCIENEILMYLRSNKKNKDVTSLNVSIGEDKEGNEIKLYDIIEDPSPSIISTLVNDEYLNKLKEAIKTLDERELDIISRRYGLNDYPVETQKEIASSLKISRSYVSRIEKRALTKIYLFLKNNL
ncbi:MAG: RNA polymerase sporulation sigma factor SigK [Bacilli bacterium]|nr:RNA polymerase sporulation sigma factor SigK [Bacilli bacterium]